MEKLLIIAATNNKHKLVEFKEITDNRGALVAIEHPKNLNFDIKIHYTIIKHFFNTNF